jgi:hypothetical protein
VECREPLLRETGAISFRKSNSGDDNDNDNDNGGSSSTSTLLLPPVCPMSFCDYFFDQKQYYCLSPKRTYRSYPLVDEQHRSGYGDSGSGGYDNINIINKDIYNDENELYGNNDNHQDNVNGFYDFNERPKDQEEDGYGDETETSTSHRDDYDYADHASNSNANEQEQEQYDQDEHSLQLLSTLYGYHYQWPSEEGFPVAIPFKYDAGDVDSDGDGDVVPHGDRDGDNSESDNSGVVIDDDDLRLYYVSFSDVADLPTCAKLCFERNAVSGEYAYGHAYGHDNVHDDNDEGTTTAKTTTTTMVRQCYCNLPKYAAQHDDNNDNDNSDTANTKTIVIRRGNGNKDDGNDNNVDVSEQYENSMTQSQQSESQQSHEFEYQYCLEPRIIERGAVVFSRQPKPNLCAKSFCDPTYYGVLAIARNYCTSAGIDDDGSDGERGRDNNKKEETVVRPLFPEDFIPSSEQQQQENSNSNIKDDHPYDNEHDDAYTNYGVGDARPDIYVVGGLRTALDSDTSSGTTTMTMSSSRMHMAITSTSMTSTIILTIMIATTHAFDWML